MKTATQKAASRPGPGLGEGMLVDRQWLDAHLLDPRVRVVEVDASPVAYDDWHIDGAVLWNVYTDLKDADYRTVGTAALERLVARSGIGSDSTVVFYGYAPALGFWLMNRYRHLDVRILDCSRDTWRAGGHPWSTAASSPPADGYRLGGEDHDVRADRVAVQNAIGRPGTTLVDVRSAAEYRGERFGPPAGWSRAVAPVTCHRLSTSPSTASTTPMGRSAPPQNCAVSSHRPFSTAAVS